MPVTWVESCPNSSGEGRQKVHVKVSLDGHLVPVLLILIPVHPVAHLPSVCLCWALSHWQELPGRCSVLSFPLLQKAIRRNSGFSHLGWVVTISGGHLACDQQEL